MTHVLFERLSLTLVPVSATWPESVRQLANSYMRDPVRIVVGRDDLSANQRVEQVVDVFDDPNEKE